MCYNEQMLEDNFEDSIFISDKYGKRNRTDDILNCVYDSKSNFYDITYKFDFNYVEGISLDCKKLFKG